MDIEGAVRSFICERGRPGRELGPDDNLLSGAWIDSLGVIELAALLQQRFGIELADEDFVPENFATLSRISMFVSGRIRMPLGAG